MTRAEYNEEIYCQALIVQIQRNRYRLNEDLTTQIALVRVARQIDPEHIEASEVDALVDRLRELLIEGGHRTNNDLPAHPEGTPQ